MFVFWAKNSRSHLPSQKENLPLLAICKSLLSLWHFYYSLHNYGAPPRSEQSPVHKYRTSNYEDARRLSGAEPDKMGCSQAGSAPPVRSWPGVLEAGPVMQQNMTALCFFLLLPLFEPLLLLLDGRCSPPSASLHCSSSYARCSSSLYLRLRFLRSSSSTSSYTCALCSPLSTSSYTLFFFLPFHLVSQLPLCLLARHLCQQLCLWPRIFKNSNMRRRRGLKWKELGLVFTLHAASAGRRRPTPSG